MLLLQNVCIVERRLKISSCFLPNLNLPVGVNVLSLDILATPYFVNRRGGVTRKLY